MRTILTIIVILLGLSEVWSCSCSRQPDLDYDFIALVEICQTQPLLNIDSSYSGVYKIEIDILELFKGSKPSYVFVASGYENYGLSSCDTYLNVNSVLIVRATYSSNLSDFVTSLCSHNIFYKSSEGKRNWVNENPDWRLEEYRLKYFQIEPWKFNGDTLVRKYPNGNIESIEYFQNGKRHGAMKTFLPSGKIWRIKHFKEGLQHGVERNFTKEGIEISTCLLYTSPSPRDATLSRMPSSA